jgi:hypothetical protein
MLLPAVNSDARCTIVGALSTFRRMEKKRKPRKGLEQWQKDDAKRLKALWLATVESDDKASQEAFAAQHGIGTQGAMWQFLNGYTPLNIFAAAKFARGLNCKIDAFSPTLATLARDLIPTVEREEKSPIEELSPEKRDLLEGYEHAPQPAKDVLLVGARQYLKKRRGEQSE